VINDQSLGQKLGQAGYERAEKFFSIEKNVRELGKLLGTNFA